MPGFQNAVLMLDLLRELFIGFHQVEFVLFNITIEGSWYHDLLDLDVVSLVGDRSLTIGFALVKHWMRILDLG